MEGKRRNSDLSSLREAACLLLLRCERRVAPELDAFGAQQVLETSSDKARAADSGQEKTEEGVLLVDSVQGAKEKGRRSRQERTMTREHNREKRGEKGAAK